MLIKLTEYDLKEIKRMEEVIGKCKVIPVGDDKYIEADELLGMIEDLNYEYNNLQDKFLEFEADVQDNYKRVSQAEQYGISNRDFM